VQTEAIAELYKRTKVQKAIAIRYKATTTETTSAFKSYTNAYTITDIKLKGMNGLSYFRHQYNKLLKYLDNNPSMIVLIVVYVRLLQTNADGIDEIKIKHVKSRKYTIHNKDDLTDSLNNMAQDINTLIEIAQFHKSNLRVDGIESIEINDSRYNQTRGGFLY
jgi:ActR/RegA family two-component response regulator